MSVVRVRASSWGRLFDCAHAWEGVHILGMNKPSGLRAQLGTAIHASTAVYDLSRMNHTGTTAIEAAAAAVDTLRNPDREVDYSSDDLTVRDAEKIALTLHARYCAEISPRYEFVAVEMETTPMQIDCGNGVTIELTGTMDRARAVKGKTGIRVCDLKSGRTAVTQDPNSKTGLIAKTKGHHAQVGTYQILTEFSTGREVEDTSEIIGLNTGKPLVAVGSMCGARGMLIGTPDSPGLITYAAEMFKSGLFPPNPQSHLCSEKFCARWATCRFHP